MLLVLDIGNTDMVFGFREGNQWLYQWRYPSAKYASFLPSLIKWARDSGPDLSKVRKVTISSVVPGATPSVKSGLRQHLKARIVELDADFFSRLTISIDNPEEIGSDLVANAVAAWNHFRTSCIVVDFGTALSFTMVGEKGSIEGVAIAPGLNTAMRALFANTARLPMVQMEFPSSVIGKNTSHAIQAGIMGGYVGLVKEIIQRAAEELPGPVNIVATGGLSGALPPLTKEFDLIDPLLTLNGIYLLGEASESNG